MGIRGGLGVGVEVVYLPSFRASYRPTFLPSYLVEPRAHRGLGLFFLLLELLLLLHVLLLLLLLVR